MKKTALALLLLVPLLTARGDNNVLQNGDFTEGVNQWEGDCHSVGAADADAAPSFNAPTPPSSAPGIVVRLDKDHWTKVTQDFNAGVGQYEATLTYSLSPDFSLSRNVADFTDVPAASGLTRLKRFSTHPNTWILVVCDIGAEHFEYWKMRPKPNEIGNTVNFHGRVQLNSDDSAPKGFFLAFPPGTGTITLLHASLVKVQ
jgi:hypothetical protein